MSGLAGVICQKGFESDHIQKMTDIIKYRGPEDEGFILLDDQNLLHSLGGKDTPDSVWFSHHPHSPAKKIEKLNDKHFVLALGHRRLSILDLSPASHQPMSYANGRYWIILNGKIYNYQYLKNELQELGYEFISRTDTEVVLAAYAEWGTECLNRFVGMWAFAIYDHKLKEIFLARDRYGIKPIYYWFSPEGHFCFASEIKQFTVCKGWEARMNPKMVYDYLVYSFTDHSDETMFAGVYQLPSGSFYRSTYNNIKPDLSGRIKYHKWYLVKHEPFTGSFKEAADVFKYLFQRSVKEHLNADVPVGTALSGGLDSSSIVCEVDRILRNSGKSKLQKTFSSCSFYERYDEKKWMDIVINHTKVDPYFAYPNLEELFSLTSDIIWHQDEPYQSQSVFLAYNLYRLASENGIKVLLNGQGADEYMGGYGQFTFSRYAKMVKSLKLITLITDVKNLYKIRRIPNLTLIKGIIYQLLPSLIKQGITNINSSSDRIKNIIDSNKLNIKPFHPYTIIPVKYRTVSEISEHLTFYSTLPKYLRWEDRNSMAHSVEARVPFLDHRLVEFTYNLPDDFLEKDGITKRVMREAMKGLLPLEIQTRKDKMGFITPEEQWVKKDNPDLFRKKISEAISLTNGIIKPEAITYFDDVVKGTLSFNYTYWRIIMFSEWLQKFKIMI